ncbi:iron-sulfur cluster co-chaperone protein HscB, mitochondrial [Alligator sinensis]|uniref:Iron-sulfur cluster co-chaperone protein HscB, mitochondrial n=1 Tax=Alligator sinensis TaxID=38654 RepID=A0A1U8D8V5_ALLSI|nr:iron-sulfur cluster co-chaperone protein HscB, mitochondrial [Alligator sinensis]
MASERPLLSPHQLELRGVTLAEGTDDDADVEFLAEIMDINERLADPEDKAGLQELESLIAAKQEQLITDVNQAFERDDLQEAKKLLAKMKYFANLEDKVKSKKIPS